MKRNTKPRKAAVRFKAVACNHAQARPTYLVHAKSIVELAETCTYQFKAQPDEIGVQLTNALSVSLSLPEFF